MRGTSGETAAPEAFPVPLLPSGPGGVRGTSLHRARSSTLRHSRTTRGCQCEFSIQNLALPSAPVATGNYDFGFAGAAAGASGGITSDGFTQFTLNGPAP